MTKAAQLTELMVALRSAAECHSIEKARYICWKAITTFDLRQSRTKQQKQEKLP